MRIHSNESYTILALNDYQRDNLLMLLQACGYGSESGIDPLTRLNSGDWLGEIILMLNGPVHSSMLRSNMTRDDIRDTITRWKDSFTSSP